MRRAGILSPIRQAVHGLLDLSDGTSSVLAVQDQPQLSSFDRGGDRKEIS